MAGIIRIDVSKLFSEYSMMLLTNYLQFPDYMPVFWSWSAKCRRKTGKFRDRIYFGGNICEFILMQHSGEWFPAL